MAQIIAMRKHDDMSDDELIATCAITIKALLGEINAAEKHIAVGAEFRRLKEELCKRSKSDDQHEGWYRAFTLKPPRFMFNRQSADKFIAIHDFIVAHSVSYNNLPSSWGALYELTVAFKNCPDLLKRLLAEGAINSTTPRDAISELAQKVKGRDNTTTRAPKTQQKARPNTAVEQARKILRAQMDTGRRIDCTKLALKHGISRDSFERAHLAEKAADEVRRETQTDLSPDQRTAIAEEAERQAAGRREAEKSAKIAARVAKRAALKTLALPTRPVVMFGQQVWPLPEGEPAYYTYDQLFFGIWFFNGWKSLLDRWEDKRDAAMKMRTRNKFLRMFVDRRFAPGDEKAEMAGFFTVFEMLCDLYGASPNGKCDSPHDPCIKNDSF